MNIGVIVAMDKELAMLKNAIANSKKRMGEICDYTIGEIGSNVVYLQKSGIGKVNSALGAAEMIMRYNPDVIISTGCAGALTDNHVQGDIIVGTSYKYHDVYCGDGNEWGQIQGMPVLFSANKKIVDAIKNILDKPNCFANIVSGDRFVLQDEKQEIVKKCPSASVVDMESCSIAQTCYKYGVPFVSMRVISDGGDVEDYNEFWRRISEISFESVLQVLTKLHL